MIIRSFFFYRGKTMSRIARSSFTGAPTDRLETVDPYGHEPSRKSREFALTDTPFGQPLGKTLDKTKTGVVDPAEALKDREIGIVKATERVTKGLRGARSDFDKLPDATRNSILDGVDPSKRRPGEDHVDDQLTIAADDLVWTIYTADTRSAAGIANLAAELGDNLAIQTIDPSGTSALLGGVLKEMSRWEAPELLDKVLDGIKDERAKKAALRKAAAHFAANGDADAIENIIRKVGADPLVRDRPTFPRDFLNRYRFKRGTTAKHHPARLTQLVWIMDRLQPDWFWTSRRGEGVWNLAIVAYASDHAQILFNGSDTYRNANLTARSYRPSHLRHVLRSMYPLIPIVA